MDNLLSVEEVARRFAFAWQKSSFRLRSCAAASSS